MNLPYLVNQDQDIENVFAMSTLGFRLQQARKAGGHSLRSLAQWVAVSHAAIKKYEDGKVYPSSDILLKLAKALNVRIDHFFRPIQISLGEVKFRKRKKLAKKAEEAIKFDVLQQIERRFELEQLYPDPPVSRFTLPFTLKHSVQSFDELESIVQKLREHWKLGTAPIHDLIEAFESRGIRVFLTNSENPDFDGFSATIENQPILVTSSRWPGDRQRFNLAHEFAHYFLEGKLGSHLNEEHACHRFAGALLCPQEALYESVGQKRHRVEWQELILLKERFRLSIAALCYRLKDLHIISESHFNQLMITRSKNGWKNKEPGEPVLPEKAHAFTQLLFHALGEEYISESKAAELLSCSLNHLKTLRAAVTHQ